MRGTREKRIAKGRSGDDGLMNDENVPEVGDEAEYGEDGLICVRGFVHDNGIGLEYGDDGSLWVNGNRMDTDLENDAVAECDDPLPLS